MEKQIIDFAQWYSQMERSKVEAAYRRYLKETGKELSQAAVSGSLTCDHEWQYLPSSRISLKMCVKCREEVARQ